MTYEDDDGQQCEGCQFRSKRAEEAFGHTRCSTHRSCIGNKCWEPDHCTHCLKMEDDLKNLSSRHSYAQLGKIQALLTEMKRKDEGKEPHKNWEFMPIFEYKFKKLNIFQTERIEQAGAEGFTNDTENLFTASPKASDTLQIDNEDGSESDHDTEPDKDYRPFIARITQAI